MPAPDARTRNKISLNPSKVLSSSIPKRHIPRILLANVLFVFSIQASKEWLLDFDIGVFWVVMRVLACGGFGVLVWEGCTRQVTKRKEIEWTLLATASLLAFVQQASLFTAIYRLSSTRVILFSHFSTLWIRSLWNFSSTKNAVAVGVALIIAVLSDTQLSSGNFWRYSPGYGALAIHALSSTALDHTQDILSPSLGMTFTVAGSALGASIFALPFYIFRSFVLGFPQSPPLPLVSLAALPVISYSLLFLTPLTARSLNNLSFTSKHFGLSYPTVGGLSAVFGSLAFSQFPTWTDLLVASLLYVGMYPKSIDAFSPSPRTPTSRLIRSYLKTILSNPESRKIFYFLLLNLCYMLVQMLYGVWTNSLGLISDAIHMAFDCMAIGVGLFASVMATWEPNERFTYGYGRIETLSGFANGIFLILISIFIVFEAIQRILDPPEMNTSQLLLVSSLGLAVNLFGMFAMGGHHHHGGHSHSHGPSHSHGDPHTSASDNHGHSHSSHSPTSSTSHSHSHSSHSHSHPLPLEPHSHSHSPPLDSHAHSHSPITQTSYMPGHSHSHDHSDPHSHSHSPELHPHDPPKSPVQRHNHSRSISMKQMTNNVHKGHTHTPSIQINPDTQVLSPSSPNFNHLQDQTSPLTPAYDFVHDEHMEKHHEHRPSATHEGHSHNMRGVFLHVMADTLGSVGVIISTLLIQFYGWTGFDPIASLFIAILIAASVVPLVIDTGKVLCLDIGNRDVVIQEALEEISRIEGLASYSTPRFWPKDASSLVGSIHIQLAPSASSYDPTGPHSNHRITYTRLDRVVERVDNLLRKKISGLEELAIQVEEGKY